MLPNPINPKIIDEGSGTGAVFSEDSARRSGLLIEQGHELMDDFVSGSGK